MRRRMWILAILLSSGLACREPGQPVPDPFPVWFDGGYGQVEVGGYYVGLEFHDSRPLPSRISFYAPVANSLDLSTDYWKRGESRPVVMGMKVDGGEKKWIGKRPWEYALSPHRVQFSAMEGDFRLTISYDLCMNEPAAVMSLTIRNDGSSVHTVEFYTHTAIVLRSCQTYARFDAARTRSIPGGIVAAFDEIPLAGASVSLQNVGIQPFAWTSDASALAISDSGWSNWITREDRLDGALSPAGGKLRPAAAFLYRTTVRPGDSTTIVQVLASTGSDSIDGATERLRTMWGAEIAGYDLTVRSAAAHGAFLSGDPWMDRSVRYAKGILETNRHYLDGEIVPMPCPAEYNFMFTHDILLTDLSAIQYDPVRVRRDLQHLARRAKDNVLPHAYYWRDEAFVTEFCAPGNWNHLWFVLATASYLRHTHDTSTVARLIPMLSKGVGLTLTRRRGNIMVGNEPDWWDFGHAEGARAYLTILTIRALEEYAYIGSVLGFDADELRTSETAAGELRAGLRDELWDRDAGYLMNATGGLRDRHFYMGPLLAAVYGALPDTEARRLVETARRELLDPPVGVRTVAPADFHTDSVKAFYRVKGNEAGDPYLYANGGVWYLGNAWYAWALREVGDTDSAYAFYRRAMTVDGVLNSPRGQPALYEYRFSDASAPDHGRVDKPTMMWSAGFCVGTAYRIIGCEENPWNLSVGGRLPGGLHTVEADYLAGTMKRIRLWGKGPAVSRILMNGRLVPSRVIPLTASRADSIGIEYGPVRHPYLERVNAILEDARLDSIGRSLTLMLRSYEGHSTTAVLLAPAGPLSVRLNGSEVKVSAVASDPSGARRIWLDYRATQVPDTLTFQFEQP